MEIYMDNDFICGELKINESFIREIIKIILDEIGFDNLIMIVNNLHRERSNNNINRRHDNSDIERNELEHYHDSIRNYVENSIKQIDMNSVMGDENMCFKDFIIKVVDKLVELTNRYRAETDKSKSDYKKLDNEINYYKDQIKKIKHEVDNTLTELNKVLEEKKELEKNYRVLEENLSSLSNEKKALEKELNNRCREAKLIFDSIQNIDSKYIDELKPYIRLRELEPFIVSSAINIDALDKIWKVARLAIKNNDLGTSEIIRNYFEYMVKLFNDAKNETVVTIDSINEGDTYNVYDFECMDSNKSYGGIVSKLYLPGFINNYNNKRIEKSLVDIKEK